MNILRSDSSPRRTASHSRKMTAQLIAALQETHPEGDGYSAGFGSSINRSKFPIA